MIQRFGVSNPSPRFIDAVATAFRTGSYESFGTGIYGDMGALVAAILLDRESRSSILDADPAFGSFLEPLLKLIKVLRVMEFSHDSDQPLAALDYNLFNRIGEAPHSLPNVFSFFLPEFKPPGLVGLNGLVCPECTVVTGPRLVGAWNGYSSLYKYGLANIFGGFADGRESYIDESSLENLPAGSYDYSVGRLGFSPEADSASEIADEIALLFTSDRLSTDKRARLAEVYNQAPNDFLGLVRMQQLVTFSPEFQTNALSKNIGAQYAKRDTVGTSERQRKSVIFVFLDGGYDSYNLFVPHSCSGSNAAGTNIAQQYNDVRGEMAFTDSERNLRINVANQPCSEYAIHDAMPIVKSLYDDNDLLVFANAGVVDEAASNKENYYDLTDVQLFAHNFMSEETRLIDPKDQNVGTGVLGRLSEVLDDRGFKVGSLSVDDPTSLFAATVAEAPPTIVVGREGVSSFDDKPNSDDFDAEPFAFEFNAQTDGMGSLFGEKWSVDFTSGIREASTLKSAIDSSTLSSHWPSDPDTYLYDSFSTVARLMQTSEGRGIDRDFYYVQHEGWDHHLNLKDSLRASFTELNGALTALVQQIKDQNMWDDTTIVVASEFARTLTPNSGSGSDHAWGGNYFIMGGNVRGGRMLGSWPTDITDDGPLNIGRGRLLPTTSWDAIWPGICSWMGAEESDMDYILPNRAKAYGSADDGIAEPFSQSDLFSS